MFSIVADPDKIDIYCEHMAAQKTIYMNTIYSHVQNNHGCYFQHTTTNTRSMLCCCFDYVDNIISLFLGASLWY